MKWVWALLVVVCGISVHAESTNAAKPRPYVTTFVVNGTRLHPSEEKWVRFVANTVVPQLRGTREQRIKIAAEVSWWAMKEGIFKVANPITFSSCSRIGPDGKNKNARIGPLEVCETGRAWQVGLAAVQVPNFSEQKVLDTVKALWPNRSVNDVLVEAVKYGGYNLATPTGRAILESKGLLRKSWLLRHPAVGFTLVHGNVRGQCIETSHNYCYGTGWAETRAYAPTREAAMKSIADLTTLFQKLVP